MYEVYGEMEMQGAGGQCMTGREALERMRSQVLLVQRLREQIRELSVDGVHCLRTDSVGGGSRSMNRGLDMRLEKKDALERMLRRESQRMREYEQEARRWMDAMKPELYAFCLMYYIGGYGMLETSETMDRSVRQCERYKEEIGRL